MKTRNGLEVGLLIIVTKAVAKGYKLLWNEKDTEILNINQN